MNKPCRFLSGAHGTAQEIINGFPDLVRLFLRLRQELSHLIPVFWAVTRLDCQDEKPRLPRILAVMVE